MVAAPTEIRGEARTGAIRVAIVAAALTMLITTRLPMGAVPWVGRRWVSVRRGTSLTEARARKSFARGTTGTRNMDFAARDRAPGTTIGVEPAAWDEHVDVGMPFERAGRS
jgi:hypothetical protein